MGRSVSIYPTDYIEARADPPAHDNPLNGLIITPQKKEGPSKTVPKLRQN
jgi:hypothetical protein